MVSRAWLAALFAGAQIVLAPRASASSPAGCATLTSALAAAPAAARRPVDARDLVALRDLGYSGDASDAPFSIAPDQGRIAFLLRQADPDGNFYCQAMLVLARKPGARPIVVDRGGELIRMTFARQGLVGLATGYPAPIAAHWSPDGRTIAFLKRMAGTTQAWLASADGGGSRPAAMVAGDVEDLAWLADGAHLVVATRPGLAAAGRAIEREGLSGFRYDERFTPMASDRPAARGPIAQPFLVVDTATGRTRAATPGEQATLAPDRGEPRPDGALSFDRSARGDAIAWTAPRDPGRYASPAALHVRVDGHDRACLVPACAGRFQALAWTSDGGELSFLHREGWAESRLAFYRWPRNHAAPRRAWTTDGLLIGCQTAAKQLLCALEESRRPRRLVAIDPASGRVRTLFDPNPEFARLELGRVERLHWRNAFGIESFGDLVLPPGHIAGRRHPLVVVQYRTRGFLRGGTGDEFPIQALAARGFAVLSIDRPADTADRSDAANDTDYNRAELRDWRDRRSVLSSIERGVALAIARGVADPARIGITGLSDGASTAQFALVNSRRFAAAVIAGCCEDAQSVMTMSGPALAAAMHDWGYPLLSEPQPDFWRPYSLAANAQRIETPILMLNADGEYLPALEPFTALSEQRRPVALYVFPDEFHVLWQPAHRLAAYEKTLDWFDFWLNGVEDPAPAKRAQYRFWRELEDRRGASAPPRR